MIRLHVRAPFAVCRTFTAGWYRPTAGFLTHSAAYGLVLNLAGIESRLREGEPGHDGKVPASLTRPGLPACRIAVGLPAGDKPPTVQSVFQQLHNYPVGDKAGMPQELAKGNKNNISPVRREVLVGLSVVIAVDAGEAGDLEDRVVRGLRGEFNAGRYGLPFLGDNNFLPDRICEVKKDELPAVQWYERVAADAGKPREHTTRLTIRVDRADMSKTTSSLFAPSGTVRLDVPDGAWVQVGDPVNA